MSALSILDATHAKQCHCILFWRNWRKENMYLGDVTSSAGGRRRRNRCVGGIRRDVSSETSRDTDGCRRGGRQSDRSVETQSEGDWWGRCHGGRQSKTFSGVRWRLVPRWHRQRHKGTASSLSPCAERSHQRSVSQSLTAAILHLL